MSTSPDCRAVKRCCAFSGTHFTFFASPSTAAAMALQTSTSRPTQLPWLSAAEKPARPVLTPQTTWSRCLIASSVLPACALAAKTTPPMTSSDAATICMSDLRMGTPPEGTDGAGETFGRVGKDPAETDNDKPGRATQ